VDARADESAWAQAAVFTDFVVFQQIPDTEPTGQTIVRMLYDDEGLYLHFTALDPEPDKIRANLGRRDTPVADDMVIVYLDTNGDSQRAYGFRVNPRGVQSDGILTGEGYDSSWDGQWQSAARLTEEGFEAEVAIPWRSLRHPVDSQVMGVSFVRVLARYNEKSSWPRYNLEIEGRLVQQARVSGPGILGRNTGLDLIPDLTFGWTQEGPAQERLGAQGVSPGVTLRYSPVSSFWLLAAANPDFSQVESDRSQIDVNQRYALYLDEKRPFFLEGQEWFEGAYGDLAYTRSMVSPIYGARATAELGGLTLAALHALDRSPSPSVSDGGGWTQEDIGDAVAFETLVRGRQAMGQDGYVGLFFSDRSLPSRDLDNRVAAVDTRVRLSEQWVATGAVAGSATRLPGGEQIMGPASRLQFTRSGSVLAFSGEAYYLSPDFRAENGFVVRSDRMGTRGNLNLSFYPDRKRIQRLRLQPAVGELAWDTSGELVELWTATGFFFYSKNSRFCALTADWSGERYEGEWLPYSSLISTVGGRFLPKVRGYVFGFAGTSPIYDPEDPRIGYSTTARVQLTLEPVPRLAWTVSATHLSVWELDGTALEDYINWVGRSRLELYATRAWSTRYVVDYSAFADRLRMESLVAWERTPGRAFYLGGAIVDPQLQGEPWFRDEETEWQLFAKLSWVFSA